jgi:hypothetical protein
MENTTDDALKSRFLEMRKEIYNRFNEKEKTEQLVTSEEPKLSW